MEKLVTDLGIHTANAFYGNAKLVVLGNGTPIGYQLNDEIIFTLGDRVAVTADSIGYIGAGIKTPGNGTIKALVYDDTDYNFYVVMDNGESGFVKYSRLERIEDTRLSHSYF